MINRLFFSILLLTGISFTGQAQQTFRGGLVGGFNLSQIDGDNLGGYNQIGFNAGGKVYAVLSERWELSLEMLFSQQGSSRVRTDFSSAYDRIRLNFVETPVMINFRDWKLQVAAGVSYARLMSYKVFDVFEEDITELEEYKPDIFFFLAGVTFFPSEKIGFDIRWSRALNDMRADPDDTNLIGRSISIRGLYLLN